MKIELTGIMVELGETSVIMTVEAAKALYYRLEELFGVKYYTTPAPTYPTPIWPTGPYYTTTTESSPRIPTQPPIVC